MRTLSKRLAGIIAVLAVLVMAVALVPSAAFADSGTPHTITVSEPSGQVDTHSYEAYQVFVGTYDTGTKQLQGITWGSGVDGTKLLAALKSDPTIGSKFANATDAPTAAAAMSDIIDKSAAAEALAKVIAAHIVAHPTTPMGASNERGEIAVTGDGYYFIKDVSDALTKGDTYSKYILQVVGDTKVTAKDTTTTSKKEVMDTNDTTGQKSDWQNTADYDMGDLVPFKLTGTVASDYADYPAPYYFAFNDTYDKAQLGDPEKLVVKIDGATVTAGYKLNITSTGFTVVFEDLKTTAAHAGSEITVEYSSKLLEGANIGSAGNVNTSNLEFSNDSNNTQHKGKTPPRHRHRLHLQVRREQGQRRPAPGAPGRRRLHPLQEGCPGRLQRGQGDRCRHCHHLRVQGHRRRRLQAGRVHRPCRLQQARRYRVHRHLRQG